MKRIYINDQSVKSSPTKLVNVRLEKNIYDLIKKEATNNNFTIKDFIQYSALSKVKESKNIKNMYLLDEDKIKTLIFQINKIGVNINQMAKKINSNEIKSVNFGEFMQEFEIIKNIFYEFADNTRKIK